MQAQEKLCKETGIRLNEEQAGPPKIALHMSTQIWCFDQNASVLIAKKLVRIRCITGRQNTLRLLYWVTLKRSFHAG